MKKLILILLLITFNCKAQLDFLRFSTFYASYTTNTPQVGSPSFRVKGTEADNPYDFVPNFVDGQLIELTPQYSPNVILTLGIRKIARFDYQIKQNNFYTGNEHEATDYATISNAPGLEYLFQYSFVRNNRI